MKEKMFRPKIRDRELISLYQSFRELDKTDQKRVLLTALSNEGERDIKTETVDDDNGVRTVTLDATTINSKAELIDHYNIDTDIWKVSKFKIKDYCGYYKDNEGEGRAVRLNSVSCDFKRIDDDPIDIFLNNANKSLYKYQKPTKKYSHVNQAERSALFHLYDAHIDKVCLLSETNESATIDTNIDTFRKGFDFIYSRAKDHKPESIFFPVGNDFYNTNGILSATKRGTPQARFINPHDSFEIGLRLIRNCIDLASSLAHVHVPVIAGNHDEDNIHKLGIVLKILYEKNENVTIYSTRHQRKYFQYGINMLGFAHGDKEARRVQNLPAYMSQEEPQMWAATKYRRFYLGDKHHHNWYRQPNVKDAIGCEVNFLRAMSSTDKWHYDNGYIGVPKTCYLNIIEKNEGSKIDFEKCF